MKLYYKELNKPAPDGYFFAAIDTVVIGWTVCAYRNRRFLWPERVYGTSVTVPVTDTGDWAEASAEERITAAYERSYQKLMVRLGTTSTTEKLEAYLKES